MENMMCECSWRILVFVDYERMPEEATRSYIDWHAKCDDNKVAWIGYRKGEQDVPGDFVNNGEVIRFDSRVYNSSISKLNKEEWELIKPRAKAVVYSIGPGIKTAQVIDLGTNSRTILRRMEKIIEKCEAWVDKFDPEKPVGLHISTPGDYTFFLDPTLSLAIAETLIGM